MKTSRIGWFLILIMTMLALVPIADAGNLGPPVVISEEVDDQQNPAVVALPDKDLWLVVWEDWRDYTLGRRGADIYAAFVKIQDGQGVVCGEPFAVNQDARAQSMPTAAYSQGFGKILVAWQDANKPYLKYRFIDVNDLTAESCGDYILHDVQNVPYNPVFDCTECVGSYTCRKEISRQELCAGAAGGEGTIYVNNTCVLTGLETADATNCAAAGGSWTDVTAAYDNQIDCETAGGAWDTGVCYQCQLTDYAALCTEESGYWNGTTCIEDEQTFSVRGSDVCQDRLYYLTDPNETISYPTHSTCSSEISSRAAVGCAALGPEWVQAGVNSFTSGIGYEALGTRSRPKVIYNEFDDRFWFGWVDKRTGRTRFRYIAWCNVAADVLFGDGSFPAYGAINAWRVDLDDRWNGVRAADWIFPPDVFRNQVSAQGRLLTRSSSEDDEVRVYEFFDSTNSVDLAADSMSGEVYFVWEGEREEATVTVQCSERVVDFSSTSSPEGMHVFGIPSSYVPETGIHSLNISGDSASQYHPTVHFDPVTRRFLAAWEDTRDGANTKIYGQLIQAISGSPYNANFLMMTAEEKTLLGEIFSEARQTAPAVGYDHTNQRFLVTWQDSRNGAVSEENIDIYAQYVDGEGSLRGQNHLISSADAGGFSAKGNQYAPQIAYNLGNHVFLCVWKDARHFDTSRSDLYGQPFTLGQPQLTILDADGNPIYPSVLKFGNLLVGEVESKTISLMNTGDAAQELCEITGLDQPFAFVSVEPLLVDGSEDTCLELSPRMSTSMTIEFAPTRSGSYVDGFVVKTAAGDQVVGVNGGAESLVTVDRGQLDFGDVLVGVSKTLSFRIYNRGDTAAGILDISEPDDVFSVSGITTSTTIPGGGSLQVAVSFQPDAMGDFSSEISMIFSLGDLTISLKGRGVDSPVAFSPSSLDFGAVKVANEKSLVTQVKNVSGANVVIEDIKAPSNPFSLDMETALPHTIAPGESLSFTVIFRPAAKGNFADDVVLTITSGGETFTANMPVSGAGKAYPLRFFSNIPGSMILYPGQKETWAIELMGDGAAVETIRPPGYGDFEEVLNQMPSLLARADGHYIYSLFFDESEPAGKYRGQVRFDLDGAKQPVTQDFLITLKELPEAWRHCPSAPSLDVEIAGERAYHIDLVDWLRKPIPVTLSMNWGCAPKDVTEGTLYFLVMWKGRFFYLDPATGRFMEGVRPTVETGFPAVGNGTLNFNQIRPLGIDDYRGVWKFYLAVLPEGGKALFYGSAVLIIEEGTGGEVRDLG